MADLAKLVVRLEAQSAQLITELEKANGRIARFERNASGSLDKLNKRFDKFGFGVKSALGALFAGLSFKALVDANTEAAEAFGLLENAVERAGDAAGGRSAKDFARVAQEIQNVTTLTDEAVQGVQQLLLRFQNIRTDRFDDATRAVVDFAAATKRDLQGAGELIGKALADPIKGMNALAKAGVIFSAGQKAVIKDLVETGRRAEAQGIIIDALGERFGGAAEKLRNNFGGAIKAVNIALGDLMESEDGLPGATKAMNELASVLQDPAVKAGADALFSLIINLASEAALFVGKIAAGIAVIFGATGDPLEDIRDSIEFLKEQRDAFGPSLVFNLGGKNLVNPEGGFGIMTKSEIEERIKELEEMEAKILGLGFAGVDTAKKLKSAGDALNGAFELPDIEVVDNTNALAEAAEKLQKQLEAQGKTLTEQVETPMERYNRRVADADKLLAANVITLETWARALGAARGELDQFNDGMLEVSERYKTLDEQLEESFAADNQEMLDKLMESGADELSKEFDEVLKRSEKSWNVFTDQAARNTQDILADAIYDGVTEGFDGGFDDLLDSFGEMLTKMAAQAVAADIAGKLFGLDENGNPGGGGGWIDKALGWLTGGRGSGGSAGAGGANIVAGEHDWMDIITGGGGGGGSWWETAFDWIGGFFGGMRDNGGRGMPGQAVAIGRGAQPELFVPDTAGDFYPAQQWMGGGAKVTQNIYTQGTITPKSARQLEVEAARRQRIATARFG